MGNILGAISLVCAWVLIIYHGYQIRALQKRIQEIEGPTS